MCRIIAFLVLVAIAYASSAQSISSRRALITQPIDETQLVTLAGTLRKEMTPANDRGSVANDLLIRMDLQLNRAPEVQQKMDDLVNELHDSKSSHYHRWLTVDQIEKQFAPAESDIQTVSLWLQSHGFKINVVHRSNGVIGFSGTASAIREAFHTELRRLVVNGESHMANAANPQIPAALSYAISGFVALNDFRPRPMATPRALYTYVCQLAACLTQADPSFVWYSLVPDDLHIIYDMNPLYAAGITGKGQTIVVVEDSDVYSTQDWQVFRTTFGLAQRFPHGSYAQVHPQSRDDADGERSCADPGINSDDFEAILDAEWATAAAPDAAIVAAVCSGGAAGSGSAYFGAGAFIALQNIVTGRLPPPEIISVSYNQGETEAGPAYNAFVNGLYEVAVLEGTSIFVAAGDGGADADYEDIFTVAATHGINVGAEASTAYNVAVGGTDFADTYLGLNAAYWSSTNGPYYGSAVSYVPEIPWNDSCASELAAGWFGFATTWGANGFCNSSTPLPDPNGNGVTLAGDQLTEVAAGSGGPSACAYGVPTIPGVVSGTCRGRPKPLYQRLVAGNPADEVRDLPDVSMFASNGIWQHYYVVCYSDPTPGYYGYPCTGAPQGWAGGGGTSFAAPIMAGIQSLIDQATEERWGNPDFVYYALAAWEYDVGNIQRCNATLGNQIDSHCIFHDVTLGDNDVNCVPLTSNTGAIIGTFNCFLDGATNGVLSLSNTSYEPAFKAAPGWDFATGLGSVDTYNLVKAWPGSWLQ